MLLEFCIVLLIGLIIMFVMMFITTNHLNSRLVRNEDYLKLVSEENKQIKLLLKREVAMANSEIYPVVKSHVDYVRFDAFILKDVI